MPSEKAVAREQGTSPKDRQGTQGDNSSGQNAVALTLDHAAKLDGHRRHGFLHRLGHNATTVVEYKRIMKGCARGRRQTREHKHGGGKGQLKNETVPRESDHHDDGKRWRIGSDQ